MSDEPPGANVTITRTGLVGQACPIASFDTIKAKASMQKAFIS